MSTDRSTQQSWFLCYQTRQQQKMPDNQAPEAWTWAPAEGGPFVEYAQVRGFVASLNADERPSVYLQAAPEGAMEPIAQTDCADLVDARVGEAIQGRIEHIEEESLFVTLSWGREGILRQSENPSSTPLQERFSPGQERLFYILALPAGEQPLPLSLEPPASRLRARAPVAPPPSFAPPARRAAPAASQASPRAEKAPLRAGQVHLARVSALAHQTQSATFTLAGGLQTTLSPLPTDEMTEGSEVYVRLKEVEPLQLDLAATQWAIAHALYPAKEQVTVRIQRHTSRGLWVGLSAFFEAFVPAEALLPSRLTPSERAARFPVGSSHTFWLAKVAQHRFWLTQHKQAVFPIEAGDIVEATVESVGKYGIYVNLNDTQGRSGLIPNKALSHRRKLSHPHECYPYQEGDPIQVKVRGFRWDGKPELSFKDCVVDPWEEIEARYPLEQACTLRFAWWLNPTEKSNGFQAFLEPDVPGYVTDLPYLRDEASRSLYGLLAFEMGEPLQAVVKDIDKDNHRVFLSLLEAQPDLLQRQAAKLQERFQPGRLLEGIVTSCSAERAQIAIEGLPKPVPLAQEAALTFLSKDAPLTSILTPSQGVIVQVLHANLDAEVSLSLTLKGLGPRDSVA